MKNFKTFKQTSHHWLYSAEIIDNRIRPAKNSHIGSIETKEFMGHHQADQCKLYGTTEREENMKGA